jgi:hypothetical protein
MLQQCCEDVTAPSMQASSESRVTRPPHARLRMQAKLAPPTVLVCKAELLTTLKAPDSKNALGAPTRTGSKGKGLP